jgi:peptidyl-prolyl cis-trans isomerase SurA
LLNFISFFILLGVTTSPKTECVDRVAAVIEGDIITVRELEKKAEPYLHADAKGNAVNRADVLRKVLDIEIGERLVGKEIETNKARLGVSDKDIDKAIQEVMRMNNLTRDQLQMTLYGQGFTWTEYQDKIREQLERARLIQFKIQGRVQVKDADVKRRCEQRINLQGGEERICAAHILIAVHHWRLHDEVEKKRQRANNLQTELKAGADFSAYAMKYSDDKGTPDGSLGCFRRGEMLEALEKPAFSLNRGEVSSVVRSDLGFHIIKVLDKQVGAKSGSGCEDEKTLEQYRNEVYQEEFENQMNGWLQELRRKAFVEVRL